MKAKELLSKLQALNSVFEGEERKEMFAKVLSKAENVEYESAQELYDLVEIMGDVEGRPKEDLKIYKKLKEKPAFDFTSQALEKTYKKQLWHDPLFRVKTLENRVNLFEEVLKEALKVLSLITPEQVAQVTELEKKLSSKSKEEEAIYYTGEEEEEEKEKAKKEEDKKEDKKEGEEDKKEEDKKENKKEEDKEEDKKEEEEEEKKKDKEGDKKEEEQGKEEDKKGDEEEDKEGKDKEEEGKGEEEGGTGEDEEDKKREEESNDDDDEKDSGNTSIEDYELVSFIRKETTPGTFMPKDNLEDIMTGSSSFMPPHDDEEESTRIKLVSYGTSPFLEKSEEPLTEERSSSFYFNDVNSEHPVEGLHEKRVEDSYFDYTTWSIRQEKEKEVKSEEENLSFLAEGEEEQEVKGEEEKEEGLGSTDEVESDTEERRSKIPVILALLTAANLIGFLLVRIFGV